MKTYILAMTGASGPVLGLRVLTVLARASHVHIVISSGAFPIIHQETGLDLAPDTLGALRRFTGSDTLTFHPEDDLHAPIASGSYRTDGMLIVPCSMKTLASVARGHAENLIERAADVTIKEGRRLLLAPREMPLSAIHLENMLTLSRLGVVIAPPVPAFYHRPASLGEMIDFLAGKILDSMGVENGLFRRWGG